MEIKDSFQFNFLYDLSGNLEGAVDENEILNGVKNSFKSFFDFNSFSIKDIKIYAFDKTSNSLRDFTRPWQNIDENLSSLINSDYSFFKHNQMVESGNLPKLIINGNKITSTSSVSDFNKEFKKYLKPNDNVLSYPLVHKGKLYGLIRFLFACDVDNCKFTKNFLQLVSFAVQQVSNAIKTLEYIKKMETNVKFYQTMKDVAKIIETQYELNYILPILGEMIDKFISQHLIYIFLKSPRKNEYNLIWPAKCIDSKVLSILNKISPTSTIVEDEGKMGIFPLACEGKAIGAIVAYNHFEPLTQMEIEYLEQLSTQASLTVDRANSYSKILQFATLDALTGLNNRHQFAHRLKQEVATAKRQNSSLCCIMFDIDFFKKVNDTYGHAVGDCVLKNVSKVIKKEIREYDIASRYGGEEFTILTPNTTLDEAYLVAQRLRAEVEKKKINIEEYHIEGKDTISVTISVGVALYDKKKSDPSALYQDADKALYEAKERGRNRVIVFDDSIKNKNVE